MASSLNSLSRNLVGMNGMMCKESGSAEELTHIDENYVTHGMCGKCRSTSHWKLEIDLIFDNVRVGCMDEQFGLKLRNGVYPYKYMDDWKKFKENHLSLIEAFDSELNLLVISECDYDYIQSVWRAFGMKNLGDYHDLYVKINVLLLSNIFETFRTTYLEHYTLNPTHF